MTKDESVQLQRQMGFNYRQAIGELLYAMVTSRPDTSFAVIKLSQYSNDPAEAHYKAVKSVFSYLSQTQSTGLTYWKPTIDRALPNGPVLKRHATHRTAFSLILNLPFFKDLLILTGLVTPTTVDPLLHTPLNSLVLWSITSRSFKTLSLLLVAKQSLLLLVKLRSLYATFVPSWMK